MIKIALFRRWIHECLLLSACLLLAACGGGGGDTASLGTVGSNVSPVSGSVASGGYPGEPTSCSVADQRLWLRAYMQDQYFWNTDVGAANPLAANMGEYFESLLFRPTDRYSVAQDLNQFTQTVTADTGIGYGYSLAFTDASQSKLQFRVVEPLGPAAAAGLKRGDTVLAIDGLDPRSIANGLLTNVTRVGITRTFNIEPSDGPAKTVTVVSRNFAVSAVLADKILTSATGAAVGYLAYQEFSVASLAALGRAFNRFRAAGVTEMIVDLRYNGGGSVVVARALASMIGGPSLDGRVFASLRFNQNNRASDFDYAFTADQSALPAEPLANLTQVFFITSPHTASASELVINSLFPFKKVVTVGATTFGKPYGFQPRSACETAYNAVNFETFNAAGNGRFTSGLVATCSAPDDLSKALGDPAEGRTAAALGFIQTNACPVLAVNLQSKQAVSPSNQTRESIHQTPQRWAEPAFGEVRLPAMVAD